MTKPVNKYLLVEYEKQEEKTAGGLYMPTKVTGTAQDILVKGTVKAIGNKCENDIEIGNRILFNKHAYVNVPDSKDLLLVREEDVYAVEE